VPVSERESGMALARRHRFGIMIGRKKRNRKAWLVVVVDCFTRRLASTARFGAKSIINDAFFFDDA